MKTWIGVVTFTSDELALPFLMRMLRDPKVCFETSIEIFLIPRILVADRNSRSYLGQYSGRDYSYLQL